MKHENNIDNYFSRVKQNPPLMDIEKVHQIITEAKAEVKVRKRHRNLLKFTVMTTILAIFISAFLFWPGNKEEIPNYNGQITNKPEQTIEPYSTVKEIKVEGAANVNKMEEARKYEMNEEVPENTNGENLSASILGKRYSISNKVTSVEPQTKQLELSSLQTINKSKQEYIYPEQILDSTVFIELNQTELENLGFRLNDNYMELQYIESGGLVNISYSDNTIAFGVYVDELRDNDSSIINFEAQRVIFNFDETKNECVIEGIYPMLITKKDGQKILKIVMPENKLKALFSEQYNKNFRTLLPVIVRENTFGIQPIEDIIYWFLPTDEFFNRLPQNISEELLSEFDYITAEDKSTLVQPECKYFDECKNTLDVTGFKVFPNPANTSATVSFTLNEAVSGRITLVDLAGRERQVLQPQTSFAKGQHQIEVDVSNIPEGIYLLTLYSDKGVQTQRVIVAR